MHDITRENGGGAGSPDHRTRGAVPQKVKAGGARKYAAKYDRIVEVATDVINDCGLKGLTFAAVAQRVGLTTTSITYYFRRKEELAAAVYARSLQRMEAIAREALAESDPTRRVSKFLALYFDHRARALQGTEQSIVMLSDMRSLKDEERAPLAASFVAMFRIVRGFFGEADDRSRHALLTARAHILIEVVVWLQVWLPGYSFRDFERVRERLFQLLANGLAPAGQLRTPVDDEIVIERETWSEDLNERFLDVAIRLINERGYLGASIDRIVDELQLSKGSFYYRLAAKDDLIRECFRHSFHMIWKASRDAEAQGDTKWDQLVLSLVTLLTMQFSGERPLLRMSALRSAPSDVRAEVLERSNRLAVHYAGMLVDGAQEGTIRLVDPLIASQVIVSSINTAYDLRGWAEDMPVHQAIETYASVLLFGMFDGDPAPLGEKK
jgi:AcrR family transcriptional regulator